MLQTTFNYLKALRIDTQYKIASSVEKWQKNCIKFLVVLSTKQEALHIVFQLAIISLTIFFVIYTMRGARTDFLVDKGTIVALLGICYLGNKYMDSWRKLIIFTHWMSYLFKSINFQSLYGILIYQVPLFRVSMGLVYDFST